MSDTVEKNDMTNGEESAQTVKPKLDMTFEQASEELDSIANKLNSGSVPLDEMIALFERGIALSDHCNFLLEQYDGRIAKAMKSGGSDE